MIRRKIIVCIALCYGFACLFFASSTPLPNTREGGAPKIGESGVPIQATIELDNPIGSISPLIYGVAQPTEAHFIELRLPLTRWGGNPATRYNWEKGNCWNAAADWEFRNGNYGAVTPEQRAPSGCADAAIRQCKAHGADLILTIPTMGWVAKDDNNETRSLGVPAKGGSPIVENSEAISGYDPSQNRLRISQRSIARKVGYFADPPNLKDDSVSQDEWVYHLKRKFGTADKGGVRYYAMDNEPDLWAATHRDMHPVRPDAQEILNRFLDYATAVKAVDPSAQITGPVSWGWTGYFYSPRDEGSDNYHTAADRKKHGGEAFLPWFLKQIAIHDAGGKRTLDVLDVHFYPQGNGVYSGAGDSATNSLRLRSTRALWDETYTDESWIAEPVHLIPRLRKWIDESYPGTKIGLTEWNWGADGTLNGGLAVAEVLGILGREKVDIACYWTAPKLGTPGFYAYKIYRNADNQGHGFGDIALKSFSNQSDKVSIFGSVDSQSGKPVVLLINKDDRNSRVVELTLSGGREIANANAFRYSSETKSGIVKISDVSFKSNRSSLTLPPYSITLLRGE